MSVDSWILEFYPKAASQCSKEEELEHTQLKWSGTTPENLSKHNCKLQNGSVIPDTSKENTPLDAPGGYSYFEFTSGSCALCYHHNPRLTSNGFLENTTCVSCPLYKVRGSRCDESLGMDTTSPWGRFTAHNNPTPMIELIQKAIDQIDQANNPISSEESNHE